MLFGSGIANVAGQYFWTQALRLAPTTAVSPFYYLMLVWALIIGFLVWGDVPSNGLIIGSVSSLSLDSFCSGTRRACSALVTAEALADD